MYFGPIRARILMAFAALVSTALILAACGADPTPTPRPTATPTPAPAMDDKPAPTPTPVPPTPTPVPEPQVLKLGFTVPQSGSYARWGRLVSAMQCAIDEVHDSGDLGTTTIELLPEDSKADQAGRGRLRPAQARHRQRRSGRYDHLHGHRPRAEAGCLRA